MKAPAPSPVPRVAPLSSSATLVFGVSDAKPPTVAPLFDGLEAPPAVEHGPVAGEGGTLVFGSALGAPLPPPPGEPSASSGTMVFGTGTSNAPPKVVPNGPESPFGSPLDDEPPFASSAPPFRASDEPLLPPPSTSGTLEFNFDDMVAGIPPPPAASPARPAAEDGEPQTAWDRSNPRIDISQLPTSGEGGGFDLISAPVPPTKQRSAAQLREEVSTLLSGAKDLLDLDDHSGAMELISKALELDPQDPAVLKLKERSERTLQAMYESKLGDMNRTPRVKLKDDEIIWLNLDHRAGFVLAQIDGSVSFEDLFAVSGMTRLDTARILAQLVEEGVISKG
jgi:hypothetical protein